MGCQLNAGLLCDIMPLVAVLKMFAGVSSDASASLYVLTRSPRSDAHGRTTAYARRALHTVHWIVRCQVRAGAVH